MDSACFFLEDATDSLDAGFRDALQVVAQHYHVSLDSSLSQTLASLPQPPYTPLSPLAPYPPPPWLYPLKPQPPPPPRLTQVCASLTMVFGCQGLSRVVRRSQLSLPLVAFSSFYHAATTSSLQFGEFHSWPAPIGTEVRVASASKSHSQAKKRHRDRINALRRRSPPNPLAFHDVDNP